MSNYTELFNIALIHDYYADKKCPDFTIEPTTECQELLQGHRLVVKNNLTDIQVLVPLDEHDEPFIEISDIPKLTFYMKLNEMAFDNYTVLDEIDKDKIYKYDNLTPPGTVPLRRTETNKSNVVLPVNDVAVFAVIDIHQGRLSDDINNPSQYTIDFTAKAIPWSYYFITNPSPQKTTTVENSLITFTKIDSSTDPLGEALKEKYPLKDIRLYRSTTDISYRQRGRKNIEFIVNDAQPITLIEHLPNPSIYDNGVQILSVLL